MKKLYAPLLAAACFLALPVHAQTPAPQDATKNAETPNKGQMMQGDQMHKKDMKKDHMGKMKKSRKHGAAHDKMMNKSDQSQSPDTQKKESGAPGN